MKPAARRADGRPTDLGEEAQWDELEAALSGIPASSQVLMVPGNHDVAINPRRARWPVPHEARAEREQRFIEGAHPAWSAAPSSLPSRPGRKRARRRGCARSPACIRGGSISRAVSGSSDSTPAVAGRGSWGRTRSGGIGGAQLRRLATRAPAGVRPGHRAAPPPRGAPRGADLAQRHVHDRHGWPAPPRDARGVPAEEAEEEQRPRCSTGTSTSRSSATTARRRRSRQRVRAPSSTLGHGPTATSTASPRFAAIRLTDDGIWRVETHPLRPCALLAAPAPPAAAEAEVFDRPDSDQVGSARPRAWTRMSARLAEPGRPRPMRMQRSAFSAARSRSGRVHDPWPRTACMEPRGSDEHESMPRVVHARSILVDGSLPEADDRQLKLCGVWPAPPAPAILPPRVGRRGPLRGDPTRDRRRAGEQRSSRSR